MLAPGLEQVRAAKADGRWDAAYASQGSAAVPADFEAALEAVPAAKRLFGELNRADRFSILYRIHDAKTQKTRLQRIHKFVAMLQRGEPIRPPRKAIKE